MPVKPPPKYWYKIFVGECPVCGKDKGYRVRCEGKKPTKEKRYVQLPHSQTYCGCLER